MSVFIPGKKYGDDMDQQISFPIQCNFWALADAASTSKRTAKCDNAVLGAAVGYIPSCYKQTCLLFREQLGVLILEAYLQKGHDYMYKECWNA